MSNKLIGYENELWRVEKEFGYTGEDQPFTLEPGEYLFICCGAHGGIGAREVQEYGAMTYGEITLNETTTFHAVVGSDGGNADLDYSKCTGGFNGGAHGGMSYSSSYLNGPGGGGATDIRLLPYDPDEYPTYDNSGNELFHQSILLKDNDWTDEAQPRPNFTDFNNYARGGDTLLIFCISTTSNNNQMSRARVQPGYPWEYNPGRLYSFKIYEQDVLVHHFVPCYRISDNDKGAYDLMDGTYHPIAYNQQNVELGENITNPTGMSSDYQAIEYLDNKMYGTNNGQFIDTGYLVTSYTKIVMDCVIYQNQWDEYADLFGAYNYGTNAHIVFRVKYNYRHQFYYSRDVDENVTAVDGDHPATIYDQRVVIVADESAEVYGYETNKLLAFTKNTGIGELYYIHEHEFIQLDYIRAWTKGGYFNTGYIPKSSTKAIMDCVCHENAVSNYETVFGTRVTSFVNGFAFEMRANSTNNAAFYRTGSSRGLLTNFKYDERITIDCYKMDAKIYFNGELIDSVTAPGTPDDSLYPLYICAVNQNNQYAYDNNGYFTLYGFKLIDIDLGEIDGEPLSVTQITETVQRDYVPAKRVSDNKTGLFDKVNQTFILPSVDDTWQAGPYKMDTPSLNSRIMVAAGAGGGCNSTDDGGFSDMYSYGGGPYGTHSPDPGSISSKMASESGLIPSQSWGHAFGFGSFPTKRVSEYGYSANGCGGGGGGWFGGVSHISPPSYQTTQNLTSQGGGGNSYILTSSSYKPSHFTPIDSKYYFTKTLMHGGAAMGDLFSDQSDDWKNGHIYICKKETKLKPNDVIVIPTTGKSCNFTLPPGTHKLKCWGGDGGVRSRSKMYAHGGYSEGIISTTEPHNIFVYTGGNGGPPGTCGDFRDYNIYKPIIEAANVPSLKFNGGTQIQNLTTSLSPSGGGTDIRFDVDDYYHRVIVAGGAGSQGSPNTFGGAGGGETGGISTGQHTCGTNIGPGTQTSGYAFGYGGPGSYRSSGYGGAGGGGWYGGYGTTPDGRSDDDRAGSGGSGFVLTEGSSIPNEYGCDSSEYYLTSAYTTQGGNNLPRWHTKAQIEVQSLSKALLCQDIEGFKYFDKTDQIWKVLPNQSLDAAAFLQYGTTSFKTDVGLRNEYAIYTYDEEESVDAIAITVVPNTQYITTVIDNSSSITSLQLDDDNKRGSFKATAHTNLVKASSEEVKTMLQLSVTKIKDNDEPYKIYSAQLFMGKNKTSHEYLKLDENGHRIFKHYVVDEETGEIHVEERTMVRKNPEDFRNAIGEIDIAQWLLPVGSGYKIPISYRADIMDTTLSNDNSGLICSYIAEYDRILYFGYRFIDMDGNYWFEIKSMNFMTNMVANVCKIPWSTIYSLSTRGYIGGFLVDNRYFYLTLSATNGASALYQQSIVRIDKSTFSVSTTPTTGDAFKAYGQMQWYDDHRIMLISWTNIWLFDTITLTWSHIPFNSFSFASSKDPVRWCMSDQQLLVSHSNNVYVFDRETYTLQTTLNLSNNYGCRMCYDNNGKFYLVQNNYLYIYDESTMEVKEQILISPMQYPISCEYCNGAIIIVQHSNGNTNVDERRLIVYDIDQKTFTTIYLPWKTHSSDLTFQPFVLNGKYFYNHRSLFMLNYTGYSKYNFGPKFKRQTIYYDLAHQNRLEYDERFVTLLDAGMEVHNGNIEYQFNDYYDHITSTSLIRKTDYRFIRSSSLIMKGDD